MKKNEQKKKLHLWEVSDANSGVIVSKLIQWLLEQNILTLKGNKGVFLLFFF